MPEDFIGDARYRGAHNLQGAEGSALPHPSVSLRAQRTTSSITRRQLDRHRRPHQPHLQAPHDDVRAPQTVPLDRYLRHQDPDTLHPERNGRVGKQLVPRHGQLRLVASATKV